MKHSNALSALKKLLSRAYDQTRCPVCMHIVFVDGNGNMEDHGPGLEPCVGSGRNDEEVADELDRALTADRQRQGRDEARLRAET